MFKEADKVIPILAQRGAFPSPCPVEIVIGPDTVTLRVGPRDWEWDRKTGELNGALRKGVEKRRSEMETKICPCGYVVARNAKACPKCGNRFPGYVAKFTTWLLCQFVFSIMALILTLVIFGSTTALLPLLLIGQVLAMLGAAAVAHAAN